MEDTDLKDPVCGMTVSSDAEHSCTHEGVEYMFCGAGCLEKFLDDPGGFLEPAVPEEQVQASPGAEYTCPMHPEVVRPGPGSCPECGMALETVIASSQDEEDPELKLMTWRFWVALVLTTPVFVLAMSDLIPGRPLESIASHPYAVWAQLGLAALVVIWCGLPFHIRALKSVIRLKLNMFTLIGLGVTVAFTYSLVATLAPEIFPASLRSENGAVSVYFEAAAVIVTLVLLGQVLELRARRSTGDAIRSLLGLAPKTARLLSDDGTERDVPIEEVRPGDCLVVHPGEKIPTDGVVLEGTSAVDESMVTGESVPVQKSPDSSLIGATVNGTGALIMVAERVGSETILSQIVQLVSQAQRSRAPAQRLADKVASVFVPIVIAAAIATFAIWATAGPEPRLAHAIVNAVAVLIIACPCALGLATPMSITVGTGLGASKGVLFRNAEALEVMSDVDTLLVDKTGTLTEGKPRVRSVILAEEVDRGKLLALAAGLEKRSEHPLAAAIIEHAEKHGVEAEEVTEFRSLTGLGVVGKVDGVEVALGNQRLLEELGIDADGLDKEAERLRADGNTTVFVAAQGFAAGIIEIADPIKSSTPDAIRELQTDGVRVIMLTGDNPTTASAVAQVLELNGFQADVSPDRKAEVVKKLQDEGVVVAMAGDGINDAPALAQAHVGIAMGTGTDVAMESAPVTLVKGDLRGIVRARRLSRAVKRNIKQNLTWAFLYNVLGVPIAAGAAYPFTGLLLSPMIAAAAMSISSVSVISNALRLRGTRI